MSNKEEKQGGPVRHVVIEERTPEGFQRKIDEAVARGAHFFPESFQLIWVPQISRRVYIGIIKIPPDSI